MKISEFGEILARKVINESVAHPSLIKEVEKIIENYKGGVVPAREDLGGDYVAAWMYFQVRFLLD